MYKIKYQELDQTLSKNNIVMIQAKPYKDDSILKRSYYASCLSFFF